MKNIKMFVLLLLIVPIFLMDCTKTETVKYDEVERTPKPEDYEMAVYTEAGAPGEYKVIGEVRMEAYVGDPKEEVIKNLKSQARQLGADAIVNMQQLKSQNQAIQRWEAKAIVWTDKEAD
jgi:hypothetical protein